MNIIRISRNIVLNVGFQKNVRSLPAFFRNSFVRFSTLNTHPIIQKILKSENQTHLQSILQELAYLNTHQREIALKIILNKVYSTKVGVSILGDPKLSSQLAKSPQLMLQAQLFRIKQLMKSLNEQSIENRKKGLQFYNTINDAFLSCFKNLKKIQGPSMDKYEVMLHKRFADYNLLYLAKDAPLNQRLSYLTKSRQFYNSTLDKMTNLITNEQRKINELQAIKEEKTEQQNMKINAIKQNVRLLIQTNSQNIFHLFITEKSIADLQNKKQGIFPENIMNLLPTFEKALGFYKVFSKMTIYSIFYHRIKKIFLEINYYTKIVGFRKFNSAPKQWKKFDDQCWNQLITEFKKLGQETIEDIEAIVKEPKHFGNIQQLSLLLLNLRMHPYIKQNLTLQQYRIKLMLQVSSILDIFSVLNDKKVITSYLGKAVKQILEQKSKQMKK